MERVADASKNESESWLRDKFLHHTRFFHARELLVESLELHREALVVEAQQIENGCVEISDVQRVLHDVVAEVIRLSVDRAAFRATAGHPHGEAARVVIAAIVRLRETAL